MITTPNREYNVTWENVGAERLRHPDHRFEWTRQEFRVWADGIAARFGYSVQFLPIGPEDGAWVADTDGSVREAWIDESGNNFRPDRSNERWGYTRLSRYLSER